MKYDQSYSQKVRTCETFFVVYLALCGSEVKFLIKQILLVQEVSYCTNCEIFIFHFLQMEVIQETGYSKLNCNYKAFPALCRCIENFHNCSMMEINEKEKVENEDSFIIHQIEFEFKKIEEQEIIWQGLALSARKSLLLFLYLEDFLTNRNVSEDDIYDEYWKICRTIIFNDLSFMQPDHIFNIIIILILRSNKSLPFEEVVNHMIEFTTIHADWYIIDNFIDSVLLKKELFLFYRYSDNYINFVLYLLNNRKSLVAFHRLVYNNYNFENIFEIIEQSFNQAESYTDKALLIKILTKNKMLNQLDPLDGIIPNIFINILDYFTNSIDIEDVQIIIEKLYNILDYILDHKIYDEELFHYIIECLNLINEKHDYIEIKTYIDDILQIYDENHIY